MKRKLETNYYSPSKKIKTDNMYLLIQKIEIQNLKLNDIIKKINIIDDRLKNVENFIEDNKPKKFNSSPSYFY